MSRTSLYKQGPDELSLLVFNTESLYKQRHSKNFVRSLLQCYQATNEQVRVLKRDLSEDLKESQKENKDV